MPESQGIFLVKQTLNSICFNCVFSALAVWLVFRHMALVPLSGSHSLIADSILQTFIATFMSILPPSLMTARWTLTRPDVQTAKTPTVRILIRALVTALAAALAAALASYVVLPIAMPRLFAAALPFHTVLLLKCVYGMALGIAVTPFAVAAVLRGPRRGERTEELV
jgi:hypothetical protein